MLEKIIRLNSIGVFRRGVTKAVSLSKATLIYGENGRGKSTIAAVLRSLACGNVDPLRARLTFNGSAQEIAVRVAHGGTAYNAEYTGVSWSRQVSDIFVFDQDFVEQNVYAASEVNSSHHEALLEFALGSAAVKKKLEVDVASSDQVSATKRRSSAEDKLTGYMGKTPLAAFIGLAEIPDVDDKIGGIERRIQDCKEAKTIAARSSLSTITTLTFDLGAVKSVLEKSLEDIHTEAEKAVRAHLRHLADRSAEQWLSSGLKLMKGNTCPFCNQSTKDLDLIGAYRGYFNVAYSELIRSIDALETTARLSIVRTGIDDFANTDATNRERITSWAQQLHLEVQGIDINDVRAKLKAADGILDRLIIQKRAEPLAAVDTAELKEVDALLLAAQLGIAEYNSQVLACNNLISAYKKTLAEDQQAALKVELDALTLAKARWQPEVVALVAEREKANSDRDTAESAKKRAREELDFLMVSVLGHYQGKINEWLKKFGASFSVEKLKANYQGGAGAPRTDYGLEVRGTSVPAGKKSAHPCFKTALSEGDKRTLALAFFLAKLFDDSEIGKRIVVVDDIFASLDKHRRSQTLDALTAAARSAAQVVVLGHDAFFLRDVYRRLVDKGIGTPLVLEVACGADGYSELHSGFDLGQACATDYYRHYEALTRFLEYEHTGSLISVAQGMRTLLEGHLHRRFPGRIKEGLTVGSVLGLIKEADKANPLSVLQPSLNGLHELNDFASTFHHDTDGTAPRADVTETELRTYGTRLMQLLHSGYI